jgi:hypothetical protein
MVNSMLTSKRKTNDRKIFEIEKGKIQTEVFGNAAEKKSKLSGGGGRDSFNRVNDSLRNNRN